MPEGPKVAEAELAARGPVDLSTFGFDPATREMAKLANPDLRPEQLRTLFFEAWRLGLDPAAGRQIYGVVYNKGKQNETLSIQIAIDGLRTIAARTGLYDGGAEIETGDDITEDVMVWGQKKSLKHPAWARATVWRRGSSHPFVAKVRWEERVKRDRQGNLTDFWASQPYAQLEKCAEAAALRRGFPMELRGVQVQGEGEEEGHADAITVGSRPSPSGGPTPDPAVEKLKSDIGAFIRTHRDTPLGDRAVDLADAALERHRLERLSDAGPNDLEWLEALSVDLDQLARQAPG
jgi:phage recombination protein Bet